jgi:indole-3-glycerol phosphate synthase
LRGSAVRQEWDVTNVRLSPPVMPCEALPVASILSGEETLLLHLDRILARSRATVAERRASVPVSELERQAAAHTPRGFARALRKTAASRAAIIAELKKASPSKGVIRADFDPAWLAAELEKAGAAALSVLTDQPFFQGSLRNLEIASTGTQLPCLRKDFIVDEYQIIEARAHQGDAILLIVAALSDEELVRFTAEAHRNELDVLCEVHTAEELARAKGLGCDAYGVNNRDLRTFEVRLETSVRLAEEMPSDAVRVAESGINTGADIRLLREAGFQAFLIGESLMRQPSPGAALQFLLESADAPEAVAEHA